MKWLQITCTQGKFSYHLQEMEWLISKCYLCVLVFGALPLPFHLVSNAQENPVSEAEPKALRSLVLLFSAKRGRVKRGKKPLMALMWESEHLANRFNLSSEDFLLSNKA